MAYTIYRIYNSWGICYIGRTRQNLNDRLRGHFFEKPMHRKIDINAVTRIDYTECQTEANMFVLEIILVNLYKPPLNCDDKASDELTLVFPIPEFTEYKPKLFDKWKKQIAERDMKDVEKRKQKIQNDVMLREMRLKRLNGLITDDEYYNFKEGIDACGTGYTKIPKRQNRQ